MKLFICLLLVLTPFPTLAYGERVTQVYDGDTITVGPNEKIRLMCIDTPEIRKNSHGRVDTENALKARDFLRNLILDKDVVVARYGKDFFKRTLARIYLKNGKEVNKLMVDEKIAVKYLSNKCDW
jgi:endonuclease YncB( thermonuclease family)